MTSNYDTPEEGFLTPRKRATIAWVSVGALAIVASASLAPHAGWFADLIAALAAQWLMLGVVLCLTMAALRRWPQALVAAAVSASFVAVLLPGRATMSDPQSPAPPGFRVISVLQMNANTMNERAADVFRLIMEIDADIVSLLEAPTELVHQIRDSQEITRRYNPFYMAEGAKAAWPILLTRWEQRGGPDWAPGPLWRTSPQGGEGFVMRVEHPEGPFFMLQTHAVSPRSRGRWSTGNDLVARLAQRVRMDLEPLRLPIILACDLNSPPSGWRSRRLVSDCSLRRAKPLRIPAGTFPSWLPWPLTIPIDDVFVSPGVTVRSWRSIAIPGSDHRGVIVELLVPGNGAPSAPTP
jgi:endonuclease/exonuclease/phosphatase (EEP) superfamily protein YafD